MQCVKLTRRKIIPVFTARTNVSLMRSSIFSGSFCCSAHKYQLIMQVICLISRVDGEHDGLLGDRRESIGLL